LFLPESVNRRKKINDSYEKLKAQKALSNTMEKLYGSKKKKIKQSFDLQNKFPPTVGNFTQKMVISLKKTQMMKML
jgi:hypothetical protein